METNSEFVVKSMWDIPVEEQPERFAEIVFLQGQITQSETPVSIDAFKKMKANQDGIIFLAVCDQEKIIGIAQGTLINNLTCSKVFVDSVAVHPAYRGHGLGKKIMHVLEQEVRTKWPRATKIILTSAERRGTRPFYIGLGYVPREGDTATVLYQLELL